MFLFIVFIILNPKCSNNNTLAIKCSPQLWVGSKGSRIYLALWALRFVSQLKLSSELRGLSMNCLTLMSVPRLHSTNVIMLLLLLLGLGGIVMIWEGFNPCSKGTLFRCEMEMTLNIATPARANWNSRLFPQIIWINTLLRITRGRSLALMPRMKRILKVWHKNSFFLNV